MKSIQWICTLALPFVLLASCTKNEKLASAPTLISNSQAITGNGGPSGAHYNLNIIGVPKGKTADMTGNTGGRIFVSLDKSGTAAAEKILLSAGTDFQVTDANATDGSAAFTLPSNVTSAYNVFARVPGKQMGSATVTTCADSVLYDGSYYYSEITCGNSVTFNKNDFSKFVNVSDNLLTVTVTQDIYVNGNLALAAGQYDLFDPALAGYFWNWDNNGLKLVQLRFYAK